MLIGRDPSDIDALMDDLQRTLHLFGRSGAVMYALSGVDIALWDIAGKVAGKPLYQLFGGDGARDARLCEPAALLRARMRWREAAARRSSRATGRSSCTRSRSPAVKAAREAVGPDVAADDRHQLPVERGRGACDGRGAAALRSALAGGAGVAAGGSCGARAGARGRRGDRGGRERRGPDRVSPRVRARCARCGAAERHQDRRHLARCAASSRWRKSSACASCRIVRISARASSRACI